MINASQVYCMSLVQKVVWASEVLKLGSAVLWTDLGEASSWVLPIQYLDLDLKCDAGICRCDSLCQPPQVPLRDPAPRFRRGG